MKNVFKLFGIIAFVAVIVFSAAACKGKSNSSSGSAVSAASSSAKIDSLLADYEKFVDEYSSIMQKLMAGDVSAAADAQKLEARVNEWAARWEGISEKDLTPAQTLKLTELSTKLVSSLEL